MKSDVLDPSFQFCDMEGCDQQGVKKFDKGLYCEDHYRLEVEEYNLRHSGHLLTVQSPEPAWPRYFNPAVLGDRVHGVGDNDDCGTVIGVRHTKVNWLVKVYWDRGNISEVDPVILQHSLKPSFTLTAKGFCLVGKPVPGHDNTYTWYDGWTVTTKLNLSSYIKQDAVPEVEIAQIRDNYDDLAWQALNANGEWIGNVNYNTIITFTKWRQVTDTKTGEKFTVGDAVPVPARGGKGGNAQTMLPSSPPSNLLCDICGERPAVWYSPAEDDSDVPTHYCEVCQPKKPVKPISRSASDVEWVSRKSRLPRKRR